jgi:hypothetical protein
VETYELYYLQNCCQLISSSRLFSYVLEVDRCKTTVSMNIQSKPVSHHVTNQYGNLTEHTQTNMFISMRIANLNISRAKNTPNRSFREDL